jgi:hypothetical protein
VELDGAYFLLNQHLIGESHFAALCWHTQLPFMLIEKGVFEVCLEEGQGVGFELDLISDIL